MTILLLDAGNTRLKWATIDYRSTDCHSTSQARVLPVLSNQGSMTYQWSLLPSQLHDAFNIISETVPPLTQIVLCNVAGQRLDDAIESWLDDYLDSHRLSDRLCGHKLSRKKSHQDPGAPTLQNDKIRVKENDGLTIDKVTAQAAAFGVTNAYREPSQLGADRWVALVAAHYHHQGPSCIIDSGTALTVDLISKEGQHAGGLILPGMALMRAALVEKTDAVQVSEQGQTKAFDVHSTEDAVKAGVHAAMLGAVQQVLAECQLKWGAEPHCVVTGGNAEVFKMSLPESSTYDSDWVLKGLAVIAGSTGQQ